MAGVCVALLLLVACHFVISLDSNIEDLAPIVPCDNCRRSDVPKYLIPDPVYCGEQEQMFVLFYKKDGCTMEKSVVQINSNFGFRGSRSRRDVERDQTRSPQNTELNIMMNYSFILSNLSLSREYQIRVKRCQLTGEKRYEATFMCCTDFAVAMELSGMQADALKKATDESQVLSQWIVIVMIAVLILYVVCTMLQNEFNMPVKQAVRSAIKRKRKPSNAEDEYEEWARAANARRKFAVSDPLAIPYHLAPESRRRLRGTSLAPTSSNSRPSFAPDAMSSQAGVDAGASAPPPPPPDRVLYTPAARGEHSQSPPRSVVQLDLPHEVIPDSSALLSQVSDHEDPSQPTKSSKPRRGKKGKKARDGTPVDTSAEEEPNSQLKRKKKKKKGKGKRTLNISRAKSPNVRESSV